VPQATQEQVVRAEPGAGQEAPPDWRTPGGIPVFFRSATPFETATTGDLDGLRLHMEHTRLGLLRGFDQLLCLDGLTGVEHLPHQIETVRKVLRHFRGRVLLADEVGLEVHAGHGLTYNTVSAVARIPQIVELNIGHFLIGEAIFGGMHSAIRHMRTLMDLARSEPRRPTVVK